MKLVLHRDFLKTSDLLEFRLDEILCVWSTHVNNTLTAVRVIAFVSSVTLRWLLRHSLRRTLAVLVIWICSAHVDIVRDEYVLIDLDLGILCKLSGYTTLYPAHIAVSTLIDGAQACMLHSVGMRC